MACPFSKFCLGMCDWTDCPGLSTETTPATDKTLPISASHSPCSSCTTSSSTLLSERFSNSFSDDELAVPSKGVPPANMDKSTRWASTNFFSQADLDELFNPLTTNDAYMHHDPCELSISLWEFIWSTKYTAKKDLLF